MDMDYNNVLKTYIPLVDFIAGIVGPNCEVVLHDLSNVDESIVAIRNNHISGRKVGGPLTNLGLKLLKKVLIRKKISYLTTQVNLPMLENFALRIILLKMKKAN